MSKQADLFETSRRLWIETVYPTAIIWTEQEAAPGGEKFMHIRTRLMFADKPNNNKRIYSEKLLDREILGRFKSKVMARKVAGEMDHPENDISTQEKMVILWNNVWKEKDQDGVVWYWGEGVVPNSTIGRDYQANIRAGFVPGFSARGKGTLMPSTFENQQVGRMADDYWLATFDTVVGESNQGADLQKFWVEQTEASESGCGLLVCKECLPKIEESQRQANETKEGEPNMATPTEAEVVSAQDKAKKDQEARAKKYGIGVKAGGHITKPTEFKDVPDEEWLDPTNFRYPADAAHVRAAAAYWGKPKNQKQYTADEKKIIQARLDAQRKKYKVGQFQKESAGTVTESMNGGSDALKLGQAKAVIKLTSDEAWQLITDKYVTGIIVYASPTEIVEHRTYTPDGWESERDVIGIAIDSIGLSTRSLKEAAAIEITDEAGKAAKLDMFISGYGIVSYDQATVSVAPDAIAEAIQEYIKTPPNGVVYLNGDMDDPVGRMESFEGEAKPTTENTKTEGGEVKMDLKTLKIEDLTKERPDMIEAITKPLIDKAVKEATEALETKIKGDKAFLETALKALGAAVPALATPAPAGDQTKTETALKDLGDKLALAQKEIDAMKAEKTASEQLRLADAEIEKVIKEQYAKESPAVLKVVRTHLMGKIAAPAAVAEQLKSTIGLVKETMATREAPGKGVMSFQDPAAGLAPVTEQADPNAEQPDATGLTPSQKARQARSIGLSTEAPK